MRRLSDNQKTFGRFTLGTWHDSIGIKLESGGDEDPECTLIVHGFGRALRVHMPQIVAPYRSKVMAQTWDAATVAHMGRDWYYDIQPRAFGFSVSDGFLQVFHGRQTDDSSTEQRWSWFMPWTQWRHVRLSLYDASGKHFWTEGKRERYEVRWSVEKACPKAVFEFADYDGKVIQATTRIQEREHRFGEGWFKWLSLFRRARVYRSLDLKFSEEVGPEKGSWKGGTTGHGIEMLPGELHEAAFRRYCEQEHRSKYNRFRITFIGPVAPEVHA